MGPIERLRVEASGALAARGFELLAPDPEWTGKYHIVSWIRRTWKEDLVRLGWRTRTFNEYFLDAQWSVPRPGHAPLRAAGINPGYLRRGVQVAAWPRRWPLISALLEKRWRAEAMRDLDFALAWLERCASTAGAIQELGNPERNGPRPGSEAYAYIENYVRVRSPASGLPTN